MNTTKLGRSHTLKVLNWSLFLFFSFLLFKTKNYVVLTYADLTAAEMVNLYLSRFADVFFNDFIFVFFIFVFFASFSKLRFKENTLKRLRYVLAALVIVMWVYGLLNTFFFKNFHTNFLPQYGGTSDLNESISADIERNLWDVIIPVSLAVSGLFYLLLIKLKNKAYYISLALISLFFVCATVYSFFYDHDDGGLAIYELYENYVVSFVEDAFANHAGTKYDLKSSTSSHDWVYPSEEYPYFKKYVGPPLKENRMNVIIIFVESLRDDFVHGKYEQYNATPFLKELENNSLVFTNLYAPSAVSANAVTSVLCSTWSPSDVLMTRDYSTLNVRCITEILKDRNYTNAVFHAGYFVNHNIKGFLKTRSLDLLYTGHSLKPNQLEKSVIKGGWGYEDKVMITPMAEWLSNVTEPFFLMYFTVIQHPPFDALPPEYRNNYTNHRRFNKFIASQSYADDFIRQFYLQLEENGMVNNTLIVVVGDHGHAVEFNRGHHASNLFQPETHIFGIIHNPVLFKQRMVVDKTISQTDILPTIQDLLKIYDYDSNQGTSALVDSRENPLILATGISQKVGIIDGDMKYIYTIKANKHFLFNITSDPYEQIDLSAENPELVKELNEYVMVWDSYQMYLFHNDLLFPPDGQLDKFLEDD